MKLCHLLSEDMSSITNAIIDAFRNDPIVMFGSLSYLITQVIYKFKGGDSKFANRLAKDGHISTKEATKIANASYETRIAMMNDFNKAACVLSRNFLASKKHKLSDEAYNHAMSLVDQIEKLDVRDKNYNRLRMS